MKKSRSDPKIDWLKWIVDFLNADFSSLERAEKLYLYLGLERFAFHFRLNPPVSRKEVYEEWLPKTYTIDLPPEIWKRASSIQGKFREFFMERIEGWIKTADGKMIPPVCKKLPPINMTLDLFVGSDRKFHLSLEPTESIYGNITDLLMLDNLFSIPVSSRDHKETWLKWMFENSMVLNSSSEVYLISLIILLDDVPYNWVRKCRGKNKDKECGRYFFNPTERKKDYCNSSCASRSIQQKKRNELKQDEKKYEAYKKKMKTYMKKRYREKIKAQLGPKVIVGRKVTNRKEG